MKSLNRFFIIILILCVVFSTGVLFYKLSNLSTNTYIYTGYDVFKTGYINMTIDNIVQIELASEEHILSFGGCAPGNTSVFIRLDNNETEYDENEKGAECTGDNGTRRWITINNTGNTYVNVTLLTECSSDSFIGGTNPQLNYTTANCWGGDIGWQEVSNSTPTLVCSNMTPYVTGFGFSFNFSVGAVIPSDATGYTPPCSSTNNGLLFIAQRN